MEGVEEVRQLDDKRLHWGAKVGGKEKEWNAEIVEEGDLERFKEFIELRGAETGAWRGEIEGREVRPPSSATSHRSTTTRANQPTTGEAPRRRGRPKSTKCFKVLRLSGKLAGPAIHPH